MKEEKASFFEMETTPTTQLALYLNIRVLLLSG
jgi:hypothetical protein